jgi:hypothetical protein
VIESKLIDKVLKKWQVDFESFSFSDVFDDVVSFLVLVRHTCNFLPVVEEALGECSSLRVAS